MLFLHSIKTDNSYNRAHLVLMNRLDCWTQCIHVQMHVGYVCVCLNFSAATPTTTCAKTPLDPPRGNQAKSERHYLFYDSFLKHLNQTESYRRSSNILLVAFTPEFHWVWVVKTNQLISLSSNHQFHQFWRIVFLFFRALLHIAVWEYLVWKRLKNVFS